MTCSQLVARRAAQPRPSGAARRVAVTCAAQVATQRSSELWRSQQSRRLLLLYAHEQRVAAKGQVAAVAPQQLAAAAGQLQLDGPAAAQIGAMLARLEGDGFISRANGTSRGTTNGANGSSAANGSSVNGSKAATSSKATNGTHINNGSSSSLAALNGRQAAAASSIARQAPQLPKP